MTRLEIIQRLRRQIYGDFPTDDATITDGLVNSWLSEGVALAAKSNYKDNIQIEGIGYINNSFYTTFKAIAVTKDEKFLWKINLPELPLGIGKNEGVSTLKFKDSDGNVALPSIPLSANQITFSHTMRPIPNKVLYYSEGGFLYAISPIVLSEYTASVTMVSGGDSADLTSILNVPSDYLPVAIEYIKAQVMVQKQIKPDGANDGLDLQ